MRRLVAGEGKVIFAAYAEQDTEVLLGRFESAESAALYRARWTRQTRVLRPSTPTYANMEPSPVFSFGSATAATRRADPATEPPSVLSDKDRSHEINQAYDYVSKIKKTLHDKPDTYRAFLDLMSAYQNERKSIKDVYEEVCAPF